MNKVTKSLIILATIAFIHWGCTSPRVQYLAAAVSVARAEGCKGARLSKDVGCHTVEITCDNEPTLRVYRFISECEECSHKWTRVE